jgi:hypothetical protein
MVIEAPREDVNGMFSLRTVAVIGCFPAAGYVVFHTCAARVVSRKRTARFHGFPNPSTHLWSPKLRPKRSKEETIMKLLLWVLAFALALPVLLVAIALGPVTVGLLCAVGFGLIVAAIVYLVVSLEHAGSRLVRRIR